MMLNRPFAAAALIARNGKPIAPGSLDVFKAQSKGLRY